MAWCTHYGTWHRRLGFNHRKQENDEYFLEQDIGEEAFVNLRKKQIPRYSHWGVAITIYRVGNRYSAQFTLSGHDRRRIEKSTEALALQGAKDLIEKRLQVDPSIPLEERFVFIPPCLRAWITVLRKASCGPIYSGNYLWKDYYAIAAKAGLQWKKNAPRKSFNTYHAALSGSLSDTAGEAGNSEQMIRQYYRKTLPQAARTAREWFSLGPEQFIKVKPENGGQGTPAARRSIPLNASVFRLRISSSMTFQ